MGDSLSHLDDLLTVPLATIKKLIELSLAICRVCIILLVSFRILER